MQSGPQCNSRYMNIKKFDNGIVNFMVSLLSEDSQKRYEENWNSIKNQHTVERQASLMKSWLYDRISFLRVNGSL